jgi:hypothetical protein
MKTGNDLLKMIPEVLRARGYRLYTKSGQRLVDLWLNGGTAVLGHTPRNMLRELKNTASRGLYAPFPHFTEGRFLKALSKLFPDSVFRIYAFPPPELVSLFISGAVRLWRPFVEPASPFAVDESVPFIPVIPGIQLWHGELPVGLCVVAAQSEALLSQLPPGDTLSPILLAVAARGVYNLIATPERGIPLLPRVDNVLQNSRWKKNGAYLSLNDEINDEEWAALFKQFLDAGFLLPPVQCHPLILPAELSNGEETKLAALL